MSVETVRPDATTFNDGTVTGGGGDLDAVLADDNDATYVDLGTPEDSFTVGFADPTIPAGAVIKNPMRLRVRMAKVGATHPTFLFRTAHAGSDPALSSGFLSSFWTVPVTFDPGIEDESGSPDDLIASVHWVSGGASVVRVYALYLDVTYVEKPTVTIAAPSGTVDVNRVEAEWDHDYDISGGTPNYYQVVVVADGDTPGVDDPILDSGIVGSPQTSHAFNETLPEGAYEIGVRVAQLVNGEYHWSDYDSEGFTVDVDSPGEPDVVVTPQSAQGRIRLDISDNAGDAATASYEVERQLDGEWEAIRIPDGGLDGTDVTAYDLEAPNGVDVTYRVRALSADGLAASDWTTTDTTQWSSSDVWLKDAFMPDLNMVVEVASMPGRSKQARRAVFQPLGATQKVSITDTRAGASGTIAFNAPTTEEQEALDALLDRGYPLLMQHPPGHGVADRWLSFGDQDSTRWGDKSFIHGTTEAMPWDQVERPEGDLVAWPTGGGFDDTFSELLQEFSDLEFLFIPEAS